MKTESFSKSGLIVGLGNILRGDERFGCCLLEGLAQMPFGQNIQLTYLADDCRYAGGLIYGMEVVFFVGAFPLGGTAGRVYDWSYEDFRQRARWMGNECESLRFLAQTLAMSEMAGAFPKQIRFLWTEPRTTSGYGLSIAMRKPMHRAVRIIQRNFFECGLVPEKVSSLSPILHTHPYRAFHGGTASVEKKHHQLEGLKPKNQCIPFHNVKPKEEKSGI